MFNDVAHGMRLGIGAYLGLCLFRLYSLVCGMLALALLPAVVLHAWGPVLLLGVPALVVWLGGYWLLCRRGSVCGR